jgi:hypothetical protein
MLLAAALDPQTIRFAIFAKVLVAYGKSLSSKLIFQNL